MLFSLSLVCKNTLEPGDTNTDENCQGDKNNWGPPLWHAAYNEWSFANPILFCVPECDNCAQTLLHDLEKLDDELGKIKGQLDNANASMSSQDRLKKLEQALYDTKVKISA